ncbi:carboxypeptidase-like regulatory domain-containing protein [Paenibacillus flagellatus]|uniref:Carboxypeptidase regulatory-like domain-containing protein n=1 Tax=Paenibacillus flagellatus TaxID=2211139 RepID=A0A2V5KFX2_9BACL|nr:carboxypeptidase-like regulatory domain-containing protein [Paenibacillus flagellatus]PYI57093.1 hypothetical protein DLM86_01195 [Paenibacillus flagellatus]
MLKIKIKVKHAVMALVAAAVLLPLADRFVVPEAKLIAARKQLANGELRGKKAIADVLESGAFSEERKRAIVRETMVGYTPDRLLASNFDLYVGPAFTSARPRKEEPFGWEEKLPYLQWYADSSPVADAALADVVKHLAYGYHVTGRTDRAMEELERAERRFPEGANAAFGLELALRRAGLAVYAKRYEEAARIVDETAKRAGPDDRRTLDEADRLRARLKELAGEPSPSLSVVSGAVKRSDGTPVAHAGVFLREASIVNRSVTESDPYQTVTDENGAFAFRAVVPGSYQLYLGLDFDQISGWTWPVGGDDWIDLQPGDDATVPVTLRPLLELQSPVNETTVTGETVEFRWEPVAGAAYYTVNAGVQMQNGTTSVPLRTHVKDNALAVPVERLYDLSVGISFETSGDWTSVDPATVLAFADPGNRFFWTVDAYDANGKLLTKSGGYRLNDESIGRLPFFRLKERTLTEADRLVAERRYDEALAAYKRARANDPDDVHPLRMIVRLLQTKAAALNDRSFEDEALPYRSEIVRLRPVNPYVSALLHAYYEKRDWSAYNALFEKYGPLREDPLSGYERSIHATALAKQGKLGEAKRHFEAAMKLDGSHRFVGTYAAVAIASDRSFDAARRIAEAYPDRSFGPPLRNWRLLVANMEAEAVDRPAAYIDELAEKLGWVFGDETGKLRSWIEATDRGAMKAFVQAVMGVR